MPIVPQEGPSLFDGKVCHMCGIWYLFSQFHKQRKTKDGYYSYCKSCTREVRRRFNEKNRQQVTEYQRLYRLTHRRANSRLVQLSPEEAKKRNVARTMAWRRANPAKVQVLNHQRRARLMGGGGSYSAREWNELCERYDWRCLACGATGELTVDHIVPLARGGTNGIDNVQPLCRPCNNAKATKTINFRT